MIDSILEDQCSSDDREIFKAILPAEDDGSLVDFMEIFFKAAFEFFL